MARPKLWALFHVPRSIPEGISDIYGLRSCQYGSVISVQ